MNETSAKEWLIKAWHNLSTAKLLYDVNHYEDIIAVEIHYAIEKFLKSFLAYENKKIPKTHNLNETYELIKNWINLDEYIELLENVSDYHIEEAYPTFNRFMPDRKELKEMIDFAEELFDKICNILDIKKEEIINL